MQPLFALFLLFMVVTMFVAIRIGGSDERFAAIALLLAALVSPIVQRHSYAAPEMGIVIVDAGLFMALLVVAMRSRAFWPIWAAGFQLCGLAVHFAAAKSPLVLPSIYAETLAIWAFPVVGSVIVGTWFEARAHHEQR